MGKHKKIKIEIDLTKIRDPNFIKARTRKGGVHELPKKKKKRNERRKNKQNLRKEY